jgi:hypothetical protein
MSAAATAVYERQCNLQMCATESTWQCIYVSLACIRKHVAERLCLYFLSTFGCRCLDCKLSCLPLCVTAVSYVDSCSVDSTWCLVLCGVASAAITYSACAFTASRLHVVCCALCDQAVFCEHKLAFCVAPFPATMLMQADWMRHTLRCLELQIATGRLHCLHVTAKFGCSCGGTGFLTRFEFVPWGMHLSHG